MPRSRRHHRPGAVYHVMFRGNDGQQVFFRKSDLCKMCLLLQEGVERFGHRILAHCFMKNHIHLAVQAGESSISKAMHNLSFRYTQFVNWKHERGGHLFQGRFKSILVDSRSYLLELVRYIHLNPVRAGIVDSPEDFEWSSHLAYLGEKKVPWVEASVVLSRFSEQLPLAIEAYQKFVLSGIGREPPVNFESGIKHGVIGDDDFIERVKQEGEEQADDEVVLYDLIDFVCSEFDIDLPTMARSGKARQPAQARAYLSYLVLQTPGLTLEQLSRVVHRDPSSLGQLAARVARELGSGRGFGDLLANPRIPGLTPIMGDVV